MIVLTPRAYTQFTYTLDIVEWNTRCEHCSDPLFDIESIVEECELYFGTLMESVQKALHGIATVKAVDPQLGWVEVENGARPEAVMQALADMVTDYEPTPSWGTAIPAQWGAHNISGVINLALPDRQCLHSEVCAPVDAVAA